MTDTARTSRTSRLPLAATIAAAALAVTMVLMPSPAAAIVNGELTGDRYAAVGEVVFAPSDGRPPFDMCSGFLISPTAFVTAGHCALDALRLQQQVGGSIGAHLDPVFGPAATLFTATSVTVHPAFVDNQVSYNTPDMAVLRLARRDDGAEPMRLPQQDSVDLLEHGRQLTTVGYGFTRVCDAALGHCQVAYDPARRVATETLSSVSRPFITIDQNPNAQGTGGICRGDSGGPHLLPGTNVAVALTTSFFSKWCWSSSRDVRLDTPTALSFLRSFLGSDGR